MCLRRPWFKSIVEAFIFSSSMWFIGMGMQNFCSVFILYNARAHLNSLSKILFS